MATIEPLSVFRANGDGNRYRPLAVDRGDPELNAVLDKLVRSPIPVKPGVKAKMAGQQLTNGSLQRISMQTTRNIFDAKALMELLPDMELVRDILISLILSPKDMGPSDIRFRVNNGRFTGDVTGLMLGVINTHFKEVYKINDLARNILSDVFFERGSFPILVMPENAIDTLINDPRRVSLESIINTPEYREVMTDYIGMLGPATVSAEDRHRLQPGTETFGTEGGFAHYTAAIYPPSAKPGEANPLDLKLKVIDNPEVLKRARLNDRIRRERTLDKLQSRRLGPRLGRSPKVSVGAESLLATEFTGGEGGYVVRNGQSINGNVNLSMHGMYRSRQQSFTQMQVIPTPSETSRSPIGHPLVMNLPAESVIPVHVPGAPEDHIGYFVILDENFNPLSRESSFNYFQEMGDALSQSNSLPSQVIASTRRASMGTTTGNVEQRYTVQELEQAYASMVEADLYKRLHNGVPGSNVSIARPTEVYRLMLQRTYQQRQTQLLYVPAEMMTYVAFDYNEYGVGVSLLQKSMIIGGMRAALLFANVHAGMKNAIARSRLRVTLDPEDPDPEMTVEEYIHNYVRTSRGMMPIGIVDPNDILSYLAHAAIEVEVGGGNPRYPETNMVVEDSQSNVNKPDTELEDSLKKRHHMMFGLTPEMVDNASNSEFATTLVQQNIMLSKRVYQWQDDFTPFLTDHVQCYTISSGPLLDELRRIVLDNREKLTRAQLSDQKEALDDRSLDVDEDLRNMVQVLTSKTEKAINAGDEDLTDEQRLAADAVVYEFIQSLRVELPRPDTALQKNQKDAMDEYGTMLQSGLDVYLDSEALNDEMLGELANALEPTKKALYSYFMRQWLANNNVLPELKDLTVFNPSEGPAIDLLKIQSGHITGLRESLMSYMSRIKVGVAVTNAEYAQVTEDLGEAAGGSSTSSYDTGSDTGGDTGGDDGGGDDGGFGSFDFGGDDAGDGEGGDDGGDTGGDADTEADAGAEEPAGDEAAGDDTAEETPAE